MSEREKLQSELWNLERQIRLCHELGSITAAIDIPARIAAIKKQLADTPAEAQS